MAFNTSVIKKKKSQEEDSDFLKAVKTSTAMPKGSIGSIHTSSIPSGSIGTIKPAVEYKSPFISANLPSEAKRKKAKSEDSLKLDALISSAAKKKVPVKMEIEEEEKESEDEMKPKKETKFVQHGGSLLQYLKKKK